MAMICCPLTNGLGEHEDVMIDEASLVRKDIYEDHDDQNYELFAIEYRFPGSNLLVHRSAEVKVKRWPVSQSQQGHLR